MGSIESSEALAAIHAVPVDTAAFVDTFAQGPFHEPVPVTSWREFEVLFGGFHSTSEASYAVYLFFENGGEFAWVVRVPDPAEGGLALMSAGGERQASPAALAESLIGAAETRTGIHALRTIGRRRPGVLAIPRAAELGSHGAEVYSAALPLAAELGMILLIDPPLLADSPSELRHWLHANPDLHSSSAALYYPRLYFPDALQHGRNRSFGPSGAVAGLLSWLDQERGVWQSPSGLHAVLEAVTVTRELAPEDLNQLGREGVNMIRDLPGHGVILWGARTLAAPSANEPESKYLPIRRFLFLIERSIAQGLISVACEPEMEAATGGIRNSIEAFLCDLWRSGALRGNEPADAYFVRCEPNAVAAPGGAPCHLKVQVGVALLKPGEFKTFEVTCTLTPANELQSDDAS
ncbi:MAG: phage tail sheath subtilisin-like domain-containing protein [Bryobacterales bacterium]|nr:phage tail sheath subtilisin-like domain-containing protein [Bryobacterales bacterium]